METTFLFQRALVVPVPSHYSKMELSELLKKDTFRYPS